MANSVIDTLSFAPGEIVLYPGEADPKASLYRVREGLVVIQYVDEEGNALTLRFVRPGDYFGEEALAHSERRYYAEAATSIKVDQINPELLKPEEIQDLTLHLVDALGHTYQTIQRIVSQRLKNRIAAAILDFAQTPVAAKDDAGHWLIRTTHDGIAAAVGSVRETVTKVIGELTREGYIQSGYGKLVVLNLEGLKTLASETA